MEEFGINGRPLNEVVTELKEIKEARERRILSVTWLPGEYFGKANDVATKDSIRVFANAIGDSNPLWSNPQYAKQTIFGDIIAPPLYLNCIASGWGASSSLFRRRGDKLELVQIRFGLNAGARWERFKEVREGDSFVVYDYFKDFEEKQSHVAGTPPMLLKITDRVYKNQREEVVAICTQRVMHVATRLTEAKYVRPPNVADVSEAYIYTDKELEEIKHAYIDEERRGATTRYWEDVVEREELKPVVKGPVITDDAVAFMGAIGLMQRAYGLRILFEDKEFPKYNLEDHTPAGPQTLHVYDSQLQGRIDGRNPVIAGAQVEPWLAHVVTNWMGDEGFLKILDSQHRRRMRFRDTYWCHGKVERKYVEGDEYLVDLAVWSENQQHIKHSIATATVRLVSKVQSEKGTY